MVDNADLHSQTSPYPVKARNTATARWVAQLAPPLVKTAKAGKVLTAAMAIAGVPDERKLTTTPHTRRVTSRLSMLHWFWWVTMPRWLMPGHESLILNIGMTIFLLLNR